MFQKFFLFISLVLLELVTVHHTLAATSNLDVHLSDYVSKGALNGQLMHAFEKQLDGSLAWRAKQTTDAAGMVSFALDGLGSGKVYVLQAQPFGYSVKSNEINTEGSYDFPVGKLQVQVLDGRDGSPFALSDVTLLEKQADGSLKWSAKLTTDSAGLLRIDPAQIGVLPMCSER